METPDTKLFSSQGFVRHGQKWLFFLLHIPKDQAQTDPFMNALRKAGLK
jgi:hypothetical protein